MCSLRWCTVCVVYCGVQYVYFVVGYRMRNLLFLCIVRVACCGAIQYL
jgi:hypothetical protein